MYLVTNVIYFHYTKYFYFFTNLGGYIKVELKTFKVSRHLHEKK